MSAVVSDNKKNLAFLAAKPVIDKSFYYKLQENPKKSVFIMNVDLLKFMNIKEIQDGLIQHMDETIAEVLKHSSVFNIYIDVGNFKTKLVSKNAISVIKQLIKLFQDKYPDTLEKCTIINTPKVFRFLFKIIYLFLDDVTRKKIILVGKNNEILQTGEFAKTRD
tara:strand:+ start:57 stop:548 length:492 start_codon:yes stop_codon:yes gene_type:complete